MICPDCGNNNEDKMASASKGRRVYCLECHFSFDPEIKGPDRPSRRPKGMRVETPNLIKIEINNLKKRLDYLEEWTRRRA